MQTAGLGRSARLPAGRRSPNGSGCAMHEVRAALAAPVEWSTRRNRVETRGTAARAVQLPGRIGAGLAGLGALEPNRIVKSKVRGGAREGAGGAGRSVTCMSGEASALAALGSDTLTFLATTVLVVPLFRSVKASPVLGFLMAGAVLNQLGLFRGDGDIEALSELGILFLLFEMGLELSIDRLKALAKYAFILGTIQVVATTTAFTLFELPVGDAFGTEILVKYFGSAPDLVDIRSVTEAVVIGAGLSLSSSAFVLQILSEKGELPTKFGSATLGILLLQDIAVVPLLVILPLLQGSGDMSDPAMLTSLGLTVIKSMAGLGALLVGGRVVLRRVFEVVAGARSPETFVALCLLTVTGTGLITAQLGFSDTLGAFIAGVLLAETNFRTQVEADIQPFRGLLLGLFFVTTGTSIDFPLLIDEWRDVFALLAGLIFVKTAIITAAGPRVGLTLAESVRTGFLLSQGGEFAFVVFALASDLKILPDDLNKLLIIVVVLSMFMTPLLADVGEAVANQITSFQIKQDSDQSSAEGEDISKLSGEINEPLVICGFGKTGQVVSSMLSTPLSSTDGGPTEGIPYVVFDLDPVRVQAARKLGYPVVYGDGTSASVLHSAGINRPRALVVVYVGRQRAVRAVEALSNDYPDVPIFVRARDLEHAMQLEEAGATSVVCEKTEFALRLSGTVLRSFGVMEEEVLYVKAAQRGSMENRARIVADNATGPESPSVTDDMYVYAAANLGQVTQVQLKDPDGVTEGAAIEAVIGSVDDDEGYPGGGMSGLGGSNLSEEEEEKEEERLAEEMEAGEERVYSALKELESKKDTWQ